MGWVSQYDVFRYRIRTLWMALKRAQRYPPKLVRRHIEHLFYKDLQTRVRSELTEFGLPKPRTSTLEFLRDECAVMDFFNRNPRCGPVFAWGSNVRPITHDIFYRLFAFDPMANRIRSPMAINPPTPEQNLYNHLMCTRVPELTRLRQDIENRPAKVVVKLRDGDRYAIGGSYYKARHYIDIINTRVDRAGVKRARFVPVSRDEPTRKRPRSRARTGSIDQFGNGKFPNQTMRFNQTMCFKLRPSDRLQ